MSKIKLLHLISRIDIGGAEKQLLSLAANLDKKKYDICVGYFEGKGELREGFEAAGIKTKKFRIIGLWGILFGFKLYQDMKANRYDIVHTHGFKADVWASLVGKLAGIPIVISSIHNQEWYLRNPFTRLLERFLAFYIFDEIIAVSESVKRFAYEVGRIPNEKIKWIYYGIDSIDIKIDKTQDIRGELGIGKDVPLIGCMGRLVEQKGHKYFIQAAKKVIEKFPQAKFIIVGKGRLEKKLKKLTKKLNLNSSIIFAGFRKDIYSIIDNLDLLVQPSLWEGFGLVLIEAMTLGKPIVATNVGGIPEIIKDKESGILVEPRNSEALAQAIIKLLQDPLFAKKIGEQGRLRIKERFSIDKLIKEVDKVYDGLMERKLKKKLKVLEIIESTGKSGPRYLLVSLAHNLNKDKFKLEVICSTLRDRDFYKDIQKMKEAGINVIILEMQRNISLLSDIIAFFKLCFYIKRGGYDIVHTHSSKAGFLGRIAARLMGVKAIIHTPHCFCFMFEDMNKLEKHFYFYLEKFAALFCNKIIAVSESQRQDIIKRGLVNPKKLVTIENGIDTYKFSGNGFDVTKKKQELGLTNGSVILGAVGVLNESKGHSYLIEAVAKVIREGFDARLIVAGEGPLRRDLETLSDKLGLDSRVKLLGFREDIPELLSLMDIFVFPSLWEGMSLALLEALASGLPVISTCVHGAIDLIQENKRGILVKRKDVQGLVEAIRYLIRNPNAAKRMGQEAQSLLYKSYTLERQLRKIEELYLSHLQGGKGLR